MRHTIRETRTFSGERYKRGIGGHSGRINWYKNSMVSLLLTAYSQKHKIMKKYTEYPSNVS